MRFKSDKVYEVISQLRPRNDGYLSGEAASAAADILVSGWTHALRAGKKPEDCLEDLAMAIDILSGYKLAIEREMGLCSV